VQDLKKKTNTQQANTFIGLVIFLWLAQINNNISKWDGGMLACWELILGSVG